MAEPVFSPMKRTFGEYVTSRKTENMVKTTTKPAKANKGGRGREYTTHH
ncbi:MAG: hypothetical protein QW470_01255 [Candidatus Caldarchaeum sp.]